LLRFQLLKRAIKIVIIFKLSDMRKILRDGETVKKLAETFGVSIKTVYNALNGATESDLTKRIRKRAIDLGLREKGEEKVVHLN
jgi:transposase